MNYTVNILFDRFGKNVLLLRKNRTNFTNKYNGPGGEINPAADDTPLDCAIREIREETGIQFQPENLLELGTLSLPTDCKYNNGPASITFFTGVVPDKATILPAEEHLEWFPVHSVLSQSVDTELLAGNGDLLYFIHAGLKACSAQPDWFRQEPTDTPVCKGVTLKCDKSIDRSNPKIPKLYACDFTTPRPDGPAIQHTHYIVSRRCLPRPMTDPNRWHMMEPDGVVALMFDQNKERVLLLKQYRYATGEWVYTMPGGLVDPTEEPIMAIRREIYEETGWGTLDRPLYLEPKHIVQLPPVFTDPSFTDQSVQVFVLRVAHTEAVPPTLKPGNPSRNERLIPVWIDKSQAREILQSDPQKNVPMASQLTQALLYGWVCGADYTKL